MNETVAAKPAPVAPLRDGDRWLKRIEVDRRYGNTTCTTWRWVRRGLLPPPVYFNGRAHWRLSDLERFEAEHARSAS